MAIRTAFAGFAVGGVLLGLGTAMVYPTLLAAVGDVAHPAWRASAVGVYRLWRDLGYAFGALLAGITADAFGLKAAVWIIAPLTFASGVVAAVRMTETAPAILQAAVNRVGESMASRSTRTRCANGWMSNGLSPFSTSATTMRAQNGRFPAAFT